MTRSALRFWHDPAPGEIAPSPLEFLYQLEGPTILTLEGEDPGRCRALVTLQHGNEPSGLKAVHRLLREGIKPLTNLLIGIICVRTALREPVFSLRHLPDARDMNRCFREPYTGEQGALAESLLHHLRQAAPEAILDIHNTSGNGPSFAVCVEQDIAYLELASLFTHRLIITDYRLGALMEVPDLGCPVITIECGGAREADANLMAYNGLRRFFTRDQLYGVHSGEEIDLYHHPVRLELKPGSRIVYDNEPWPGVDLTLPAHIDRSNFGIVTPDTPLAWLGEAGLSPLRVVNGSGQNVIEQYFVDRDGRLHPKESLKLFMVTTNPEIALSDCLMYAVRERDHDWLENHPELRPENV